jgi:hypothetical protein
MKTVLANWSWRFGDMKGFVSILELIAVVIAVVVAMSVFFPGFLYSNKWTQANLLLNSRDLLLTMDRTGYLYNYSFSEYNLKQFFRNITPSTNIISWSEVEGTFKQKVIIACNCTTEMKNKIESWLGPQHQFIVNGRKISVQICPLNNLDNLYVCSDPVDTKHTTDVLVIWGYSNLVDKSPLLRQFLNEGNGIVEVVDFNSTSPIDDVQRKIFGIESISITRTLAADYDYFPRKPDNSSDIIYGPWKYFFNLPFPANTSIIPNQLIPTEAGLPACTVSNNGKFILNSTGYNFWICNSTHVYFATNDSKPNIANVIVSPKQDFVINKTNYTLDYIDFPNTIGIKFNRPFSFNDFFKIKPTVSNPVNPWSDYYPYEIYPNDRNGRRILLNASVSNGRESDIPVVILNNTNGKTVWMSDFSDSGISDDEKHLFLSLVFWAANKRSVAVLAPNLQVGYLTSYINVNNTDMYEVYRLGLGLGYAY